MPYQVASQLALAGAGRLWGFVKPKPALVYQPAKITIPTDEDGSPIPMLFGRCRVSTPVLVHATGAGATVSNVGETGYGAEGYKVNVFHLAMLFVCGIPPLAHRNVRLLRMWIGTKASDDNFRFSTGGADPGVTFAPEFLGGLGHGGGVVGKALVYGPGDTAPDMFLKGGAVSSPSPRPGYREMVKVALVGTDDYASTSGNGWKIGESADADGYSFEVEMFAADETLAPIYYKTGSVGLIGMNPIGALHALMTNVLFFGLDESLLDLPSFEAAAQVLINERHAYSRSAPGGTPVAETIEEILAQIDGVIYEEPSTGKHVVKLLRADYSVGALLEVGPTLYEDVPEIVDGSWRETINKMTVVWTDRAGSVDAYRESTRTTIDQANISMTGSVREATVHHPGICDDGTADAVTARDLRMLSTPLKSVSFVGHRGLAHLRMGDVIALTSPVDQISKMPVRITSVDPGNFTDGRVAITGLQDAYGIESVPWAPPTGVGIAPEYKDNRIPPPVKERVIVEAPRWLQRKVLGIGSLSGSVDSQHLMFLSRPNSGDVAYRGVADGAVVIGGDPTAKLEPGSATAKVGFTGRAVTTAVISRLLEPYDAVTGIAIGQLEDVVPSASTAIGISTTGKNLVLIVSSAGREFVAFEGYTSATSTTGTLINVHRGLLDTAAIRHPSGASVYFLEAAGWAAFMPRIHRAEWVAWTTATARVVALGEVAGLPESECDPITIAITNRTSRPYPAADFKINGAKEAISRDGDSLAGTWKRRNFDRMSSAADIRTLLRGNESDDEVVADESFLLMGQRAPLPEVNLFGGTATVSGAAVGNIPLGRMGHGAIDVKLRTTRLDGSTSWTSPTINVDAPHWRNLLRNPRFAEGLGGLDGWTTTAGTVAAASVTATSLGNNGSTYLAASTGTPATITQTVRIDGYTDASQLGATLTYYARNTGGDTDDTVNAKIEMLTNASGVLTTANATVTPSSTSWRRYAVALAVPAGTAQVRVTFSMVGVSDSLPSVVVATCVLRVSQGVDNQLVNSGFETGSLSSWTTATGGFRVSTTAPAYTSDYYAGGGNFATSEIYQDVTVPVGHEGGSACVLEFAAARDINPTDDYGQVFVEARNAGGAVLKTGKVDPVAPLGGLLSWERGRIVLDLPYGTTTVRVRLRAIKSGSDASSNCNIVFDDVVLCFYKELQVRWEADMVFAAPVVQPLPATVARWWQDVANPTGMPVPNAGFWDGTGPRSKLPGADVMNEVAGVTYTTDAVGCWDGSTYVTTAMELDGVGYLASTSRSIYNPAPNAAGAGGIAMTVVCKIDPSTFGGVARGLVGRIDASRGWDLTIKADGKARARALGTLGEVVIDSATTVADGCVHAISLRYRTDDNLLWLVVDGVATSASTSAIGRVYSDPNPRVPFLLGQSDGVIAPFRGQIFRVYGWLGIATTMPTAAQFAAFWTHGGDPSGLLDTAALGITNPCLVPATLGNTAVRLMRLRHGQVAITNDVPFGKYWGLASGNNVTNGAPSAMLAWTKFGATRLDGIRDAEGLRGAVSLNGTSTQYIQGLIDVSATADLRVSLMAKAPVAHSMVVELRSTTGALVDTKTVALDVEWQRIDLAMTWNNATADAYLRIYPSNDGTARDVSISHVVAHQDGAFWPTCLPTSDLGTMSLGGDIAWKLAPSLTADPASRIGLEGEIRVTGLGLAPPTHAGAIATLSGTGNQGLRALRMDATPQALFDLGNDAGTVTTSEVALSSPIWDHNIWGLRAQWSRAGLLTTGNFAGLWVLDPYDKYYGTDNDVASAFTLETALPVSSFVLGPFDGIIARAILRTREEERWVAVAH